MVEEKDWYIGLHFALGFIFLNSDSDVVNVTGAPGSLEVISLTPFFRFQRNPCANSVSPFLHGAVGASFFSEDKAASQRIGSHRVVIALGR